MNLGAEILATYRNPAGPVGRLLASGPREDRALAILMAASVLMFVARTPALTRAAHIDPTIPLDARLGITLFAMLFMLPLLAYGIAILAHLSMRMIGRKGMPADARSVLFWALFAIAPASLLHGLIEGLAGPLPIVRLLGLVVFGGFLWFWGQGMAVAYRRQQDEGNA